ncbi:MAG TPA: hydantoinase/oxoprolinase family protein [Candidatus Tumulicola sp.]|jgi:N-methylhydantoinase A
MLQVGIDVGGTFTDLAAVDSQSGDTVTLKVASTPREPQRAVIDALDTLLARYSELPEIGFLGHSTTIATNALLGQVGLELPRVALVTTHGFRDVIEIGRQNRSDVYDLFVRRPRPLVAREDRFVVRERIGSGGEIVEPLDEASLALVCDALQACENLAAVAVCLLHSYANHRHERRVADAIAAALPGVKVARSSEIDPQYREYERFSTTVVNAALTPIVARYLDRLASELRAKGVQRPLYVMRSDGGMATAQYAIARPAATIESGPASGAVAAAALGKRLGVNRLLSFDMGGTTAKAGAIVDGVAQVAGEFEAAGKTHSGRAVKGSGYPVRFPFVDLAEVSAGGGTIAWLDDAGSLRVGPLSAGADPGPACYGRADRATVTDANVVLGRLNQTHLLGGAFPIDAERSRAAVAALARPLGLSVEAVAAGIVTLIDSQMAKVLRIVTVERGLDPRDFTMAAFGGGGPLHACELARELGIARVLIPPRPGIFSAFGLLAADVREHFVYPVLRPLEELDFDALEKALAAYEAQGRATLLEQGAGADTIAFRREYDARYAGQSFELSIPYDASTGAIERRFHDAHRARYGYAAAGEGIEVVNARVTVSGTLPHAPEASRETASAAGTGRSTTRQLWNAGTFVDAPVFARTDLVDGVAIAGPATIEQYDTTTYVAPGWSLAVRDGLLVLDAEAAAA